VEETERIGRRKKCGDCADGSCRKCKDRAYHREYNRRGRTAGGRLSCSASREEARIRDLLRDLTGQEPPEPKPIRRHQCFDPDCAECQAAEAAKSRARERRAAMLGICRCGQANCDCSEWERIYREKFEDPTYYTDHGIPKRSPFADI
jgi:hypothetical protein